MARLCFSIIAVAWLTVTLPTKADTSQNLLLNGDAAVGRCTTDWAAATTVPGWTVINGSPALLCASAIGRRPSGPNLAGRPAIWGGPYGDSVLTQTIALPPSSFEVTYSLSGILGMIGGEGKAAAAAEFLDESGKPLAAPVLLVGPEMHGTLPNGTRSIRVALSLPGAKHAHQGGVAGDLSLTVSAPVTPATLSPPKSIVPPFDHVFLIMMENTDYAQVVGDAKNAPYINDLLRAGTALHNYQANYHPSDENYFAIAGGDTFIKGGQYFPDIKLDAANIADRIEAVGKSWKSYEQGMGTPCNTSLKYDKNYEPDEAPFIVFTDIIADQARCRAHLVDTKELTVDLRKAETTPAFSWIAADDYYDGEASGNGSPKSLRVQDKWLKETLTSVFDSPAWRTQRSLLILTWDESNTTYNNHIATVVLGSQGLVRPGVVSDRHYDHYSTGRTIEEALGLKPLTENDRYAEPINDAFGQ
jgi:hypothetical protein